MTLQEAIKEITSKPKWYAGKLNQSTASSTVRNIIAGTAKPKTVREFMALFGFEVEKELIWRKK
jgi:hypothetical protein